MVSYKNLSLLAIAGSAMAAPAPHRRDKHVVWHTVVETAVVTVYPGQQRPEPTPYVPAPPPPPPAPTSTEVVVIETPEPEPEPSTQVYEPAPEPTKEAEPAPEPEQPSDGSYMSIVDEWRAKLGLKKLNYSSKLEQNALKTAREGNGQMVHQLNEGSMGQVLAPGQPDEFYHVFVGGWLCERPDMPGMDGVCASASEGWNYMGQTGHADILTADSYSEIGCGCETGIWSCDLA